jgi:hypothetical protein
MVTLLASRGNSRAFLILEVIKKALLTPAYFVFFVSGIYGFLVSITIANVACLIVNMHFVAKEIGLSAIRQIRVVSVYFSFSALSLVIGYFVVGLAGENVYFRFFVGVITFQLIYLLSNYLLRTSGFDELADKVSSLLDDKRNRDISPAA